LNGTHPNEHINYGNELKSFSKGNFSFRETKGPGKTAYYRDRGDVIPVLMLEQKGCFQNIVLLANYAYKSKY